MRLKNKIFLPVALGLCLLVLIFSLSFFFLLKEKSQSLGKQVHSVIHQQAQEKEKKDLFLFKEELEEEKKKLDALFLVLKPQEKEEWIFLSTTLASHPDLGFAQLRNTGTQQVFTLIPSLSCFYPVNTMAMNDRFFFMAIPHEEKTKFDENVFLAYPIASSTYGGYPAYLLFSFTEVGKEMETFLAKLANQSPISLPQPVHISENPLEKLGLIKILSQFFEKGLSLFPEKSPLFPKGIAIVSSDGKGKALFAKELFLKKAFFEDSAYYDKHRPHSSFFAVAEGQFLLSDLNGDIYLLNSSLYDKQLLTLGFPLSPLLKNFAKTTHQKAVLKTGSKTIGFSSEGKTLSSQEIEQILSSQDHAFPLLSSQDLTLYTSLGSETLAINQTIQVSHLNFFHEFFWETLLILLALLILFLIALKLFTQFLTKPLSDLIQTFKEVKSGQKKGLNIAKISKGQDELSELTHIFSEVMVELQEKRRIRDLLNKVVSKEIAEEILKSDLHLGGEDRVITILFADIRNFTELSQNLPPQKTVAILNSVMTLISRIIESEGGVIDKYVGDEVMALFGAPNAYSEHALRALSAAKLMVERLRKWNQDRIKEGLPPIEIGIGISTGLVVAGNMGAEDRLNYTVVGPSVNLASRLCKAALPNQIIISEFTWEEPSIKDSFFVESLPPVALKGFSEPVKVYQVKGFKWET